MSNFNLYFVNTVLILNIMIILIIKDLSRKELLIKFDIEIYKKINIIILFKKQDQLDLLTKTLLNKNQCFMLRNRIEI